VGDSVRTGGRLGALQPGGSHCAPRACLHWGWIRGDTYLDPLLLVGAGPVRLLPLWREQPVDAGPAPVWAALRPPVEALDWRPVLPYAAWRPPSVSVVGPGPLFSSVRRGGAPVGRPVAADPW
jgi:hypothetical protein